MAEDIQIGQNAIFTTKGLMKPYMDAFSVSLSLSNTSELVHPDHLRLRQKQQNISHCTVLLECC